MAGKVFADYVKLVKCSSRNEWQVIGPKDVLEPIFLHDMLYGGMKMSTTRSSRHANLAPLREESIIEISHSPIDYGSWTWSAWVTVLTSNGFTCKSVAHGYGDNGEIWLFERRNS